MKQESSSISYIKGFNGIRAFSILLVVLTHLDLSDYIPNTDFVMTRVWRIISGDAGVMIFFVLSGFLITLILLNEKHKTGKIHLTRFFKRRFLRLLPPLLLFFILILLANASNTLQFEFASILYALFYAYNYVPNDLYSVELGHLWSLGVEEQFYLTWPFALFFIKRQATFYALILIILITSALALYYFPKSELNKINHPLRWFIPAIAPIMIGCFAGVLSFLKHTTLLNLFKNSWIRFFGSILLFTSPIYLVESLLFLSPIIQSFGIAGILTWIYFNQESKFMLFLEFAPIRYIGIISYGIYVYQGFFLRTGGGSAIWFQQFPTNIVFTLALAILSFHLIEKPILRLKKHI